jgi:hypothetical protein
MSDSSMLRNLHFLKGKSRVLQLHADVEIPSKAEQASSLLFTEPVLILVCCLSINMAFIGYDKKASYVMP